MNHNKVLAPEGVTGHRHGNWIYAMDINKEGGYLFNINDSYSDFKLYKVSLEYIGTFTRSVSLEEETIRTNVDKLDSDYTISNYKLRDCVQLITQKYGNSGPSEYPNQHTWQTGNKAIAVGYNIKMLDVESDKLLKSAWMKKDHRKSAMHEKIVNLSIDFTDILRQKAMQGQQQSQLNEAEKLVDKRVEQTSQDL